MKKAIVYMRCSTNEQEPELQRNECIEFVKKNDWELVEVLQEQESAYKDETKRKVFNMMIERAKKKEFDFIVSWDMDRFSRQEPIEVLKLTNILSKVYGVEVKPVNGDAWSDVVTSMSGIQDEILKSALSNFTTTVLKGLEYKKAFEESKKRSKRIKLAVVRNPDGVTLSRKGNKWGRKPLPAQAVNKIIKLRFEGKSLRDISNEVKYADKNKNMQNVSKSGVHKTLRREGIM